MRRALPALVLALAAAAPALSASMPDDTWTVTCKTDAMTDIRSCGMSYITVIESAGDTAILGLNVSFPDGQPMLLVRTNGGGVCRRDGAMIRIDRNKAVAMDWAERTGMLHGAAAAPLIGQMKAGGAALVRVHRGPSCTATDFKVTLRGFTAGYNRLAAESK